MMLDPALRLLLRVWLGGVLLLAAAHKLRDPARFRAALAGYALLPRWAERPVAAALAAAELALGIALCVPAVGAWPALGAAALFALYAGAIALNLRRGRREIDCGCGPRPQPLRAGLVVRNAALIAAGLAAALPAQARALTYVDLLTIGGGAVAIALLQGAAYAALASGARLRELRIRIRT